MALSDLHRLHGVLPSHWRKDQLDGPLAMGKTLSDLGLLEAASIASFAHSFSSIAVRLGGRSQLLGGHVRYAVRQMPVW